MLAIVDVAIIGGGPAGSVAGSILRQAGHSVLILEKEAFPRFRVGESMVPASCETLHRIGVKTKLDRGGFLIKYGGEICSACGTRVPFYFRNGLRPKWKTSYQVERAKFDQVLLDHARELGCDVREQTAVTAVKFHPDRVELQTGGQAATPVQARYVLDCSGRHSLLANYLRLREPYPDLRKFSVYAYYDNVARREGEAGTLTRMIRTEDGWIWMIPLVDGKCSIGLVTDVERYRAARVPPETALERVLREQPEVSAWVQAARRYTPVYATGEFSYRVTRLTGARWLLAGDAAGFIDPVFSNGIYMAIFSGEKAADALTRALREPAGRAGAFRGYEAAVQRRFEFYLRMVRGWYTQSFIEIFLHPKEMFDLVPTVN
ncbi:MAG: tryptophan 7-halogenase, partial [Verrucomicrobia bacterium]|nr:tryptophan 7-halogenase [Verrucomicrobiota bacterium]